MINLSKFIIKVIIDKNRKFGIYHFTDNESMSWYDFAKKILIEHKLLNKIKLVEVENYRTFAERPKSSILSMNNT